MIRAARSVYRRRLRRYAYLRHLLSGKPPAPFDCAFVIGQNKTGTTSMARFLEACGLRHLSINEHVRARYHREGIAYLDQLARHFHSFDDLPWNRLEVIEHFMSQDRDFRFILTTRDPDAWFDSWVRFQRKRQRTPPPEADRARLTEGLRSRDAHCRLLAARFARPLLELDLERDADAAKRVAAFLSLDPAAVPPMPHANRTR